VLEMMAMEMQRKAIETEKDEGVSEWTAAGLGRWISGQAKSAEATSRGSAGAGRAVKPTWGLSRVLSSAEWRAVH